jgi:hypothetical protein
MIGLEVGCILAGHGWFRGFAVTRTFSMADDRNFSLARLASFQPKAFQSACLYQNMLCFAFVGHLKITLSYQVNWLLATHRFGTTPQNELRVGCLGYTEQRRKD